MQFIDSGKKLEFKPPQLFSPL